MPYAAAIRCGISTTERCARTTPAFSRSSTRVCRRCISFHDGVQPSEGAMTIRMGAIPKDPYLGYDPQAVARLAAACLRCGAPAPCTPVSPPPPPPPPPVGGPAPAGIFAGEGEVFQRRKGAASLPPSSFDILFPPL